MPDPKFQGRIAELTCVPDEILFGAVCYLGRIAIGLLAGLMAVMDRHAPHAFGELVDFVSKEKRSNIMRGARSKNTRPELKARSLLHRHGYRCRLHAAKLPGHPDIALPKYHTVIFVHGCFWHNHEGCPQGRIPTSNSDFWITKIGRTKARDIRHSEQLGKLGWMVLVVWECELADEQALLHRLSRELKV